MKYTTKQYKKNLKNIKDRRVFLELVNESLLTKLQKKLLIGYYLNNENFKELAVKLDYSLSYIYKQHIKALNKLN